MLNKALRQLRVFHDITQVDLAKKLGVSNSYISELESGTKSPSLEVLEGYSKVFSVSMSSILYFAENIKDGKRRKLSSKILRMLEFISGE